eukprot:COSAG02_NODE_440_length_22296_cov_173.657386_15_plen_48_part_00
MLDNVTERGFLLGPWIADAKQWANSSTPSDASSSYFEWQAKSQVSKT